MIASAVPAWSIHRRVRFRASGTFVVVITIGTRTFESDDGVDEAGYRAIADMVSDVVPIGCERIAAEDVVDHRW